MLDGVYSEIQEESFRMQSLLQAKHRQTSIIRCFKYNLNIAGSHFGEWYTNIAKNNRCQIGSGQNFKIGGRQILQWVPKPKDSVPPSPPG